MRTSPAGQEDPQADQVAGILLEDEKENQSKPSREVDVQDLTSITDLVVDFDPLSSSSSQAILKEKKTLDESDQETKANQSPFKDLPDPVRFKPVGGTWSPLVDRESSLWRHPEGLLSKTDPSTEESSVNKPHVFRAVGSNDLHLQKAKEKELSLATMAYLANVPPVRQEDCKVCPAFEKESLKHLLKPGIHVR